MSNSASQLRRKAGGIIKRRKSSESQIHGNVRLSSPLSTELLSLTGRGRTKAENSEGKSALDHFQDVCRAMREREGGKQERERERTEEALRLLAPPPPSAPTPSLFALRSKRTESLFLSRTETKHIRATFGRAVQAGLVSLQCFQALESGSLPTRHDLGVLSCVTQRFPHPSNARPSPPPHTHTHTSDKTGRVKQ